MKNEFILLSLSVLVAAWGLLMGVINVSSDDLYHGYDGYSPAAVVTMADGN